ncbi:MAG TPA: hypothetical protein VJU87_07405 [Gemmatimonadaceae bacterium]|nr:hypothetical protein [Gemmatimonadaceae bacterium]
MASPNVVPSSPARPKRPLPALALPRDRESRRAGALISILLHALILALLVTPLALHHELLDRPQGAGGPGPAGGGGGGHGGTGGALETPERLQFIVLPKPQTAPVTVAPVAPLPQPTVVPKVEPPKAEPPLVEPPKAQPVEVTPLKAAALPNLSVVRGEGGGTGRDGTNGNGPGTGGGVGTGVGTGRGSAVGPGTGGGAQGDYPPSPIELFIPPLPAPSDVRGFHLIAEYDVDETGRILSFDFTPTKNGGYNKELRDVLRSVRFRPGTRPDGTPVRMKVQISYDF